MNTRRRYLTLLGAGTIGLAGCGGSTPSSTLTETPGTATNNTTDQGAPENSTEEDQVEDDEPKISQREQSIQEGLPLEGLGAYEDQMLEAGPVQESTADEINSLVEGAENPEEEADRLSEMLTDENFSTHMAEFYRQKEDSEDTVVVNENYGFFQDSGPILEIYTVEDGQLQSGPILSHTSYGETSTQALGDGENPQYLHDMRDSTDGAQTIPQDYQAMQSAIEHVDDEGARSIREFTFEKMSNALFGVGSDENFIFYDGDSAMASNSVQEGAGTEEAQALADVSTEYVEEGSYGEEVWTSAEYTESGWEFRTHSDWEPGDQLPGEQ